MNESSSAVAGPIEVDVDADAMRRAGAALRRAHRLDNRREIVVPVEPTARILRLRAAATVPVAEVMARLGSALDEAGERWRPRPQRHTDGDRNPSMVQRDGSNPAMAPAASLEPNPLSCFWRPCVVGFRHHRLDRRPAWLTPPQPTAPAFRHGVSC